MVKKRTEQPQEHKLPSLAVPRSEAKRRINEQIEKLKPVLKNFGDSGDVEQARAQLDQWAKYNMELLKRLFDSNVIANEYSYAEVKGLNIRHSLSKWLDGYAPSEEIADKFVKEVEVHVTELKGILERLELIPEPAEISAEGEEAGIERGSDIFIVHGHDESAKQAVARFIEKLGLKAIILHEQPNAGRTIIEKFEDYANVGFAVVLMTPDDVGATKDKKDQLLPRARQNVVFELGFFVGKLGRNRVCALHKEEVEIPSDYTGVLYVAMDEDGGWQLKLAKEIKAAGISVDLNKVI
jgi:predicted nucleotide-binding protein